MAQQDNDIDLGESHKARNPSNSSSTQVQVPASRPTPVPEKHKGLEVTSSTQSELGARVSTNGKSATIEALGSYDWVDFQSRYDNDMAEANNTQKALLKDFDGLMSYYGVWAEASSDHDDDRAMKRLKTRQAYIQSSESSLEEKREHYTRVVDAFKKALELLAIT